MSIELKRLHAVVHGRVHGVSFRHYTTLKAIELSITGWVHNTSDGTVEVVAEGTQEQLEKMLTFLQRGSPHAQVKQVDTSWQDATDEFSKFTTHYFAED